MTKFLHDDEPKILKEDCASATLRRRPFWLGTKQRAPTARTLEHIHHFDKKLVHNGMTTKAAASGKKLRQSYGAAPVARKSMSPSITYDVSSEGDGTAGWADNSKDNAHTKRSQGNREETRLQAVHQTYENFRPQKFNPYDALVLPSGSSASDKAQAIRTRGSEMQHKKYVGWLLAFPRLDKVVPAGNMASLHRRHLLSPDASCGHSHPRNAT